MTTLRERMIDDLRIRNYAPRTINTNVAMVARFTTHFDQPPARLGPAEIREFQLHLINQKPEGVVELVQPSRMRTALLLCRDIAPRLRDHAHPVCEAESAIAGRLEHG